MPPSSLQQQAMQLAAAGPAIAPPPYAVRGPRPSELPPAAGGGFEIQIGAYATAAEADRALATVRSSAGTVLRGSEPKALAVTKEARRIYRARFVGLDSRSAAAACLELRRRQIDCFVMRAE